MAFDFEALRRPDARALIVAELSANHRHNLDLAIETIGAMARSGADAVKVQTYTPDTMTLDSDSELFTIKQGTIWDGTTLHKLYEEAYLPWEWHRTLKSVAEDNGLLFFSAPFDRTAVDFLEELDIPMFKIASFEITDIPLIEYVASKGKPVILSTGIAALSDLEEAVSACRRTDNHRVAVLKCTSAYPTPFSEANLATIPNLRETFSTVVGLSDHTPGVYAPVVAVTLGAKIIEKHFILSRAHGGPDAAFSLEPSEFAAMAAAVRQAEELFGTVNYQLSDRLRRNREFARSLFVVRDIKKGEPFSNDNVRSIRPAFGLPPKELPKIIGRNARVDIGRGTPLSWDLVQ